jgi:uroporphyrinogen decarboxylase
MTPRERVIASLQHRQPDKTPYNIGFTQPAHAKMAAFLGDSDFAGKLGNCLAGIGAGPHTPWTEPLPHVRQDPFGVQWNVEVDKDIGVVCNTCVTAETVEDYVFPDFGDTYDADFRAFTAAHPDEFRIADLGFSLFERAWTLCGMETLFMAMADDPAFAHRLLDRILAFNLQAIERACAHDIDAMMFGDDWGQQTGVMMGEPLWREFIGPRVRQMYGAAKARGKAVFIHSCGKVDTLFPDLISYGLDVFNPFQPEVIDVYAAKRTYGDRLSFFGGISTQRTLPYGTPQETRDEVRRLLDEVGKDGGYIAAPAHSIPGDAKPENIAAMLEVLQGQ